MQTNCVRRAIGLWALRHVSIQLTLLVLIVFGGEGAEALALRVVPAYPVVREETSVTVEDAGCTSFERLERVDYSIYVYTSYFPFDLCPPIAPRTVSLGILPAGWYTVFRMQRDSTSTNPPYAYSQIGQYRFIVQSARRTFGSPAQLEITKVVGREVTIQVKDASANGLPDIPIGYRYWGSANTYCFPGAIGGGCYAPQTGPDGTLRLRAGSSAQNTGRAALTTLGVYAGLGGLELTRYTTFIDIDKARKDLVVPVIQFALSSNLTGSPTRYVLLTDESEIRRLDDQPNAFQRESGFLALKANTPGAVPVCRFFGTGKNGAPLSHFYTADANECAAKKLDNRFAFEGTPFWAYPASAEGACPKDSRGMTRYRQTFGTEPSAVAFVYSQSLAMRDLAAERQPNSNGESTISEGVAFCLPD